MRAMERRQERSLTTLQRGRGLNAPQVWIVSAVASTSCPGDLRALAHLEGWDHDDARDGRLLPIAAPARGSCLTATASPANRGTSCTRCPWSDAVGWSHQPPC